MTEEIKQLVDAAKWQFAVTYKDTHPHEYVLEEWCPTLFKAMRDKILEEGYEESFYGKPYRYLNYKGWKYWIDENVLNREPLWETAQKDERYKEFIRK